MGLLDDAIREHLELKRRRGADAGDISREESEALGPVRRGPDGAPDLEDTFVAPAEPAGDEPSPGSSPSWESEQPAALGSAPTAHEPPPLPVSGYEPPALPAYEPPASSPEPTAAIPAPTPSPPEPTASIPETPPRAGSPEPPTSAYEPPSSSTEPAWRAYQSPSPPPPPAPPPESGRQWLAPERASDEPDDPFADVEPAFEREAEPEAEPEHRSRLSRFRVGRKSKQGPQPAPSDERASSFEPPPLPASSEPASPYEPPPSTPAPAYAYQPPAVEHESDIVPADEEGEIEDVLEETPDFLEETPEHDRLWFEQRPPRDFDFDDK